MANPKREGKKEEEAVDMTVVILKFQNSAFQY
jgi:hypothetical protein